MRLRMWTA